MTTVLTGRRLSARVPDSVSGIFDIECVNCEFINCYVPVPDSPASRLHISNVRLTRCTHSGCTIEAAVLEDVFVEHLTRTGRDPLSLRGCVFRRVTLRGPISFFLPKPLVRRPQEAKVLPEFWHDNARLYSETDWALDISDAMFGGLVTFEGIPSHLIRRDPSAQFVIPSTAAPRILGSHPATVWAVIAQEALNLGVPSIVVAAGKRAKTFQRDVAALRMLQDQGLAE